jgi:hypothetical protein
MEKEPREISAYNPLDKRNLGESVAEALLSQPVSELPPPKRFWGAGVYAIYYKGDFPAYDFVASANQNDAWALPIYVGKAVPKGARKGAFGLDLKPGAALYNRLRQHSLSIKATALNPAHFFCRYLVVEDIWIPLGESLLISKFRPLWNVVVEGFGNHTPGKGRFEGMRSPWDMIHPGRGWAQKCAPHVKTIEAILSEIADFKAGKLRIQKTPEEIVAEESEEESDIDDGSTGP